ncbi:MAG: ribonuclease P protein subunit [Nanoarchaeota archaeon]|nr:ribonuclease P protein subunit [Nanoarchaeota archaeon]MCG2718142.1 ribonuclease P protein subunit [Nanoarchaeota archaeon]
MKIQPADLVRSELIGLEVEVVEAGNKSLVGLKGLIVDETKNTLSIERGDVIKKVLKSQVMLNILFDGQTFQIDGKVLVGRPEDRLKKVRRIK